ncbi:MAG TPA: tetratricopeptide repeat protein [Burkholderiaceae bacterium]|nr:tetratricopeptide repeat protein [Burkholderiaceae bacterium]
MGSESAAARDALESATWRLMSFYDTPLADLDAAIAADPSWTLPHAVKAGFLFSLTEPAQMPEATRHLDAARALVHAGTPERERAHLDALDCVREGRWAAACRVWDRLLMDEPRDALALQWVQLWDFYRGDAVALRARPARALPEWDEDDPLYPHVLALWAFGLEENHRYAEAEDAGRRALSIDPRSPWAVHAVAHVMEMQGRFEDGAAWLRSHQAQWAEGNGFAVHLWWHKALFRIEGLDIAGTLRVLDGHFAGDRLEIDLQRVDAASLLWRLHLLGADVAARCRVLADAWPDVGGDGGAAGHYAFNDVHALMPLLAAGDVACAEHRLARCAERAMAADDVRRDNHAMAREVGLPLARGLVAFARGEHDAAADLLYAARAQAPRFGGSHAQRDVIDLTLLAACARGSARKTLGRALLNERLMAKPLTPLTRHWADALGDASHCATL